MIQVIVFDLGGVLFTNGTKKFSKYLAEHYHVTVEEAALLLDKSDVGTAYRTGKITRDEFWAQVKERLHLDEHADILEQKWIAVYELIEGTRDIIQKLYKKYRVFFLSDNVKERMEAMHQKYGFMHWFHGGVSSHEVGIRKPEPAIYKIILEKTGLLPEEILFIDDKESNLIPAKDLGMQTLLFESPEKLHRDLHNLKLL